MRRLSSVRVADTNTEVIPNMGLTGGSMTTGSVCEAVRLACLKLRRRLAPVRESMARPDASWTDVTSAALAAQVDLCGEAMFQDPGTSGAGLTPAWACGLDGVSKDSGAAPFSYFNWGAGCTEVEVDVLSGEVTVLRSDAGYVSRPLSVRSARSTLTLILCAQVVYDCGRSLNPGLDIGQAEGAFVMCLGFYLHEHCGYLANGAPGANGTWEYKPPAHADPPIEFNVELLHGSALTKGVLRSKSVGEPPKVLSYTAYSAVRRAIQATRAERGLSAKFALPVPATADRITAACAVASAELRFDTPDAC